MAEAEAALEHGGAGRREVLADELEP